MKVKVGRIKFHNSVLCGGVEYSFVNNMGKEAPHKHVAVEVDGEWVKVTSEKAGIKDVTFTRANNVIYCKELNESEADQSSKAPVKNTAGRNKQAQAEQA